MPREKITERYVVVSPAYGRDYKSASAAKADFLEGKDFKLESITIHGMYCSVRDFAPGVPVEVRYARLTKAVIVEVPSETVSANPNAAQTQAFPKGRWT
jgi:hypothetical protein